MMNPVYILSACAISPQHSFDPSQFLKPMVSSREGKLFVTDPDYRQFINPVAIRRMSRLMKMGISTGMRALELAGVTTPDAIITGTGLGSMTDMEQFLKDMINLEEQALNPTSFIQSTYNSANGWLAMQTKCTGYNQTYVNRGFSLELSLLDAQLLLDENGKVSTVLVGCMDEMTPDYFIVKSKVHYWKKDLPDSFELLQHSHTKGTIGGEGTAFFTLSASPDNSICSLREVKMLKEPTPEKFPTEIGQLLQRHGLTAEEIDVVICGMNGDVTFQPLYDEALSIFPEHTSITAFKHLTGEYPTASGFAVWLASQLFGNQQIPDEIVVRGGSVKSIRHLLIVNHYILNTASLMLLSA
jgi:3-oxoacyl-(acyl-carrier-protein) synthase